MTQREEYKSNYQTWQELKFPNPPLMARNHQELCQHRSDRGQSDKNMGQHRISRTHPFCIPNKSHNLLRLQLACGIHRLTLHQSRHPPPKSNNLLANEHLYNR